MTDLETIEAARRLFASDTPGDTLGRRLLAIAEREHTENQELRNLLSPLRDAVLYARAKRRPLGIGQASDKAPTSTTLRIGVQFGRERYTDGFWIECDELGPADKDNPNPATRIAVELLRLAYAIADKISVCALHLPADVHAQRAKRSRPLNPNAATSYASAARQSIEVDWNMLLARGQDAQRTPGRKSRMWALLTEIDDGNPPRLREVASFGFWAAYGDEIEGSITIREKA